MNTDRSVYIRGIWGPGLLLALWVASGISNVAYAGHVSWHQQSLSYTVDLGVVPASVAEQDQQLVAIHKATPHGAFHRSASTRHILVTVFKNSDMVRVTNASVRAEVVENDLIHVKKTEKPLEIMDMAGAVTYCNFFDLHWNGEYQIHVKIHEPGKQTEEVTFLQDVYDLPK